MKTLALALLLAVTGTAQLIDVGSPTDRNFTGGTVWDRNTPGYEDLGAAPYADIRYGASFTYRLVVPMNGFYRVRAYLMENRSTNIAAGQRIFTITVNGQASAPIDIFAAVGSKTPYILDLFAVTNSGTITVAVTATKGNAVVSALEVAPMALTDLDTGAITGDSIKLKNGYVDVFPESNADWKKKNGIASLEPRTVPLEAVVANRFGYTGPMVPLIGTDGGRMKSAMMANGTVSVEIPERPAVVAFGFPNMFFSERLTWTAGGRWTFRTRPNPANSLAVYKNGTKLMQDAYALSWIDPNQLPDAVVVPGTLPNDIILADYVAGGIPGN